MGVQESPTTVLRASRIFDGRGAVLLQRDGVVRDGRLARGDDMAGAHDRNGEELVHRVRVGGQPAAEALISATSLAAASLGMSGELGAVDGNPEEDIGAVLRVRFVMRDGRVLVRSHRD